MTTPSQLADKPASPPQAAPVDAPPDPWWAQALDSVARPYYAFCKGAARVLRRGSRR